MSNSANMTVAEKLAQHIKNDKLIEMLGDEDVITDMCRKVVEDSLKLTYLQRDDRYGYSNAPHEKLTPIGEVATEIAKQVFERRLTAQMDAAFESPEMQKAITDMMQAKLVSFIDDQARKAFTKAAQAAEESTYISLSLAFAQHFNTSVNRYPSDINTKENDLR